MTLQRVHTNSRRKAVLARCPRCKAPTLHGTDDHGLATHVDPLPITRVAELQLFLAGRLVHTVDHGELVLRDRWRIKRPAQPVLAEHRCGDPLHPDLLAPPPPRPGHLLPDADVPCPF